MRAEYEQQGVRFLALSIEPEPRLVARGIEQNRISMPVAMTDEETLGPWGLTNVPATVFVNEEGVIVAAVSGSRSKGFFERRVKDLLKN